MGDIQRCGRAANDRAAPAEFLLFRMSHSLRGARELENAIARDFQLDEEGARYLELRAAIPIRMPTPSAMASATQRPISCFVAKPVQRLGAIWPHLCQAQLTDFQLHSRFGGSDWPNRKGPIRSFRRDCQQFPAHLSKRAPKWFRGSFRSLSNVALFRRLRPIWPGRIAKRQTCICPFTGFARNVASTPMFRQHPKHQSPVRHASA